MDSALELLGIVLGGGGVLYLLLDKLVLSKGEKADNKSKEVGAGLEAVNFYKEIKTLIKEETDPLNDKIDSLTRKVNTWCCYRACEIRQRDEEAAQKEPPIKLAELLEFLKEQEQEQE